MLRSLVGSGDVYKRQHTYIRVSDKKTDFFCPDFFFIRIRFNTNTLHRYYLVSLNHKNSTCSCVFACVMVLNFFCVSVGNRTQLYQSLLPLSYAGAVELIMKNKNVIYRAGWTVYVVYTRTRFTPCVHVQESCTCTHDVTGRSKLHRTRTQKNGPPENCSYVRTYAYELLRCVYV